eukprot:NODE_43_length_33755_cov_1.178542.p14 type:complete len:287 gc:universal NODE_43_length_33755_cov_1.178542:10065-9205(-)
MIEQTLVVLLEVAFLLGGMFVVGISIKDTIGLRNLRSSFKISLLFRLVVTFPTFGCMLAERIWALNQGTYTYEFATLHAIAAINTAEELFINLNMFVNGLLSIKFTIGLKSLISERRYKSQFFFLFVTVTVFIANMLNYAGLFYIERPVVTYGYSALMWGVLILNDFTVLKVLSTLPLDEEKRVELVRFITISYRAASFFYIAMGVAFLSLEFSNFVGILSIFVALLAIVSAFYYSNSTKVFSYLDQVHVWVGSTRKIESEIETELKTMPQKTLEATQKDTNSSPV